MSSVPEKAKVRYDGAACLNVRSITDALAILSTSAVPGNPAGVGNKPLNRSELFTALWFVDTAVMSSGMYFDGTVPTDTVDQASSAVDAFQRKHNFFDFSVLPIIPGDPSKTLTHAATAACQCLPLLKELELVQNADKAVQPKEAEKFVAVLKQDVPEAELDTRAMELVADAFRGSKLIAGLLQAGPDAISAARSAFEQNPDKAEIVVGALINRFRLNYLNELASSVRGAYQPDLQFEPISKQHVRLFKDYVIPLLIKQSPGGEMQNILVENLHQDIPLPPIGLYSLMMTKDKAQPSAILETAFKHFGKLDSLRRRFATPTQETLQTRNPMALDEYLGQTEEIFKQAFRETELEAAGIKKLSKPRKAASYFIPAVLSSLASLVTGAVGASAVMAKLLVGTGVAASAKVVVGTGVGASAKYLGDTFLSFGVNSYISEYTAFKWDLQHDPDLNQPLARVADQVQLVFGRPLE